MTPYQIETKYWELQDELVAIEEKTGLYLADPGVDAENCIDADVERDSSDWWKLMVRNAEAAAGMRAEEAGRDINDLIGRTIY